MAKVNFNGHVLFNTRLIALDTWVRFSLKLNKNSVSIKSF